MTVPVESGVPVPPPTPSKNLFKRLNVYLPWDALKRKNDSFFIVGGEEADRSAIWMAASRRGIKIRTEVRVEEAGNGMRVWRVS
jgi:hypothetical protein